MPGSVVVISDALGASRFGGDPNVIGRAVRLNRTDMTIVGVMPPTFYFPDNRVDFWDLFGPCVARLAANECTTSPAVYGPG